MSNKKYSKLQKKLKKLNKKNKLLGKSSRNGSILSSIVKFTKTKSFVILLIVILVITGISLGTYFIIKKNSSNTDSNPPTTTKPTTTKPTTTKPTTTKPTTTKPPPPPNAGSTDKPSDNKPNGWIIGLIIALGLFVFIPITLSLFRYFYKDAFPGAGTPPIEYIYQKIIDFSELTFIEGWEWPGTVKYLEYFVRFIIGLIILLPYILSYIAKIIIGLSA
mgnify:CR=1 FL=1|tara:strand:- start:293 stop:949 length:657 start_codon:yes stop_codon:yes gene_type:complete